MIFNQNRQTFAGHLVELERALDFSSSSPASAPTSPFQNPTSRLLPSPFYPPRPLPALAGDLQPACGLDGIPSSAPSPFVSHYLSRSTHGRRCMGSPMPSSPYSTTSAPSPASPPTMKPMPSVSTTRHLAGTCLSNSDMIISSSRDKSVLVWHLTKDSPVAVTGDSATSSGGYYGVPRRCLTGHSHFVEDVVLFFDGQFALSGSWDHELLLWDLSTGATTRRFVGHSKDVLSVAFSVDNRQIVSASRDRTIKLWNTLGECKYTIQDADAHTNWVSCVCFSPNTTQPLLLLFR